MKKIITILLVLALCWSVYGASISGRPCPGGAAACANNPATDYVGDTTVYTGESGSYTGYDMYCYLYTAPTMTCDTGTLGYAYFHGSDSGDTISICVYLDDGDSAPDSGDTKVGCASVTLTSSAAWTQSAAKISQAVSKSSDYWVCVINRNNNSVTATRTASGSRSVYYKLNDSDPGEPNTLPDGMGSTADRDVSCYIEVE